MIVKYDTYILLYDYDFMIKTNIYSSKIFFFTIFFYLSCREFQIPTLTRNSMSFNIHLICYIYYELATLHVCIRSCAWQGQAVEDHLLSRVVTM